MERTKRDLEAVINSQNEQLTRYEKRLKGIYVMKIYEKCNKFPY